MKKKIGAKYYFENIEHLNKNIELFCPVNLKELSKTIKRAYENKISIQLGNGILNFTNTLIIDKPVKLFGGNNTVFQMIGSNAEELLRLTTSGVELHNIYFKCQNTKMTYFVKIMGGTKSIIQNCFFNPANNGVGYGDIYIDTDQNLILNNKCYNSTGRGERLIYLSNNAELNCVLGNWLENTGALYPADCHLISYKNGTQNLATNQNNYANIEIRP